MLVGLTAPCLFIALRAAFSDTGILDQSVVRGESLLWGHRVPVRVRLGCLHSERLLCADLSVVQGLFVSKVPFCILKLPRCPPECAATREMPVTSELSPTSREAPPRTSPPHPAQMTSASAPRGSPGTEPTRVVNTDRRLELLTGTTATPGSDTPTFPAWGEELSHPFPALSLAPAPSRLL